MAHYRFVTKWVMETTASQAWEVLKSQNYGDWWEGVTVNVLDSGDKAGLGGISEIIFKTKLPYKISFKSRLTKLDSPSLIEMEVFGELEGTGRYDIAQSGDVTNIVYTWDIQSNRVWMNRMAPVMKPLFVWNHDQVMHRGAVGLAKHLNAKLLLGQISEEVFFIKAVVFDFDGTLANTLPICYDAFQNVFKTFDDKDISPKEIRAMFGPSETGIIRENLSHANKEQAIELFYETYLENHKKRVKQNSDMDDLLRYLKNKGIKLGIVTGKARRSLDISLNALQMTNFFDVIVTGDDVKKPKPHPEGVVKAVSLLGVENNEAIFIGDSDADILAGREANIFTVGVQWLPDYQTSEFTIEPHAFFTSVIEFMNDIKTRIP